jgi:hypothetical protein
VGNDGVRYTDILGREPFDSGDDDFARGWQGFVPDLNYGQLSSDAVKQLSNLCNKKKCLGECGCSKDECQQEAQRISDEVIQSFREMANHPKGWGGIRGIRNAGDVHCGWKCFHWQSIIYTAMESLNLKCFKVSGGSQHDWVRIPGKTGLNPRFIHSWVNVTLFAYPWKIDRRLKGEWTTKGAFKFTPAPEECVLRIDPWLTSSPRFYSPDQHPATETFVTTNLNGPAASGWSLTIPGIPSPQNITHDEDWSEILPKRK